MSAAPKIAVIIGFRAARKPAGKCPGVSAGLQYRDFITVGVLASKLKLRPENSGCIEDNWIYLQEPNIHASRKQIINNWSPSMVATPGNIWMGVEYFCCDTDKLWKSWSSK